MISIFKRLAAALAARRSCIELHSLSDWTLKDIGLSRSQIDELFRY